jgi:hypothetical protein
MVPRKVRALFVYAALACLCVSDGVGPRLLPYPTLARDKVALRSVADSTRWQSSPHITSAAVPAKQLKAGDSLKKIPVFSAPDFTFVETTLARSLVGDLSPPSLSTVSPSHRMGRAPPAFA